ncbi:MAG: hypothetical protein ACTHNH_03130 [Mesorhizobium sp.]|jgi:hypothetical protein|uniref:hypothetical protein n=1 Tax=Mesorhizobium sp. 8 TaxID=2584466 RepID=UPI00111F1A07|nr:hypothetical protein [Mesorhizobium sp. 8]QDC03027.1 hypothetical protein FGU64_23000 [Mesorhizobium sp. 8]
MTTSKPWYLSRTIWASIVTVLTGAAGLTGLPIDGVDGQALTETLLQIVSAVSGLVAIFGRLSAKARIG